jgi:3-hydroxyacyl-CoA dehydrogenase
MARCAWRRAELEMAPPVLTVAQHGAVGAVALNNPPVNALSHPLRLALLDALSNLYADPAVQAIAVWCEGRTFIAGADIREFGKPALLPDLPDVVEFLDRAPKPVVAAIHGTALGGGLELALACHFRIAAADAKLGLPEVTLGLLPGAGGTQRLPRLIGVRASLEMIIGGVPVPAHQALSLGLVDGVFEGDAKAAALAFAERAIAEKLPVRRVSELCARLDEPLVFEEYEEKLAREWRGFLAPFRCLRAVRAAVELPFDEGLKRERQLFSELMASSESKAQRHAFFAEREVAKVPGLPENTPARPVRSAAVVGEGATAREVAQCFADAQLPVTVLAETADALDRCLYAIREHYTSGVARGQWSRAEADVRLALIRPALSYEELASADILIEAGAEELDAKREVFARLDKVGKPSAIFATSAGSVDVDALAAATRRPEAVVAMHFASPPDRKKLLENVRGGSTGADVFATVMKLGKTLGKVAVPVRGSVAERLLARSSREAYLLLEEGASREELDRAFQEFGFRQAPFASLGLAAVDAGSPQPQELGVRRGKISADEILERCIYAVINEAALALEGGVVARPLDVDLIWIHGHDFPVYRGGPLFFADQVGLRTIYDAILEYQRRFGGQHWSPAPLLERLVEEGRGFYAQAR